VTEKKVWFITGAGRGLGIGIVPEALAAGAQVAGERDLLSAFQPDLRGRRERVPDRRIVLVDRHVDRGCSGREPQYGTT